MIAMKFTIELDIGLSFLLQAALPQLVTDRETKTHRRGRSKRSYGHCRRRTEIPEAEPSPAAVATAKGRRVGRPVLIDTAKIEWAAHLRDRGHTIAEIVEKTRIARRASTATSRLGRPQP
jgi:hypothetical protein